MGVEVLELLEGITGRGGPSNDTPMLGYNLAPRFLFVEIRKLYLGTDNKQCNLK